MNQKDKMKNEQIIKPEAQSSHYYAQDGTPEYGATLREARKKQLLPSVTTIIRDVYPKPQLNRWKDEQLLIAAATQPRLPGESDKEWAAKVIETSKEKVKSSAKWGLDFHEAVETFCKRKSGVPEYYENYLLPFLEKYTQWHQENVLEVVGMEGVVTQPTLGYAGRYDFKLKIKGKGIGLGDIKTRDVKNGKPLWYDEQPIQLVAYGHAMNAGERPDFMFSMVINRLTPEPPYLKFYTQEELDIADRRWAACLELWKQIKKYSPKIQIGGGI